MKFLLGAFTLGVVAVRVQDSDPATPSVLNRRSARSSIAFPESID